MCKEAARAPISTAVECACPDGLTELQWEDLSPTEKSAASLGVLPGALHPIKFLNDAHFARLKDANALSGDLTRQLHAFQVVSSSDNKV